MSPSLTFTLPTKLAPTFDRVFAYWRDLKRADNNMPFWDDVKLSALGEAADHALLIDAFSLPERFRFNTLGKALAGEGRQSLNGRFLDEVQLTRPFAFLRAQSTATVELRGPTFFSDTRYARILLPMWGDGHISMLLGAAADT